MNNGMPEDEIRLLQFFEFWFSIYNYTPRIERIALETCLSESKVRQLINSLVRKGYIEKYTYPELKQFDIILKTRTKKRFKAVLYVDGANKPIRLESNINLTLQIVNGNTYNIETLESKEPNGKL